MFILKVSVVDEYIQMTSTSLSSCASYYAKLLPRRLASIDGGIPSPGPCSSSSSETENLAHQWHR